ncbi:Ribose transport system permease protein RbsC [compost metagenome]
MKKLRAYLPLATLVVLMIVGTFLSDKFLTYSNLMNLLQFSAESALIAVGMTLVILTGGIDLSVGSIVALAAVVSANTQQLGLAGILVIVLLIGAAIGAINGIVLTKFRVEPFMATLATMAIFRAVTLWYTNGGPILGNVTPAFSYLANGSVLGIPLPAIYVVVVFIIGYVVLNHTPFGRHVLAIGGGEETSRLFGINVKRVKIWVYIISGILAALAGMLITSRIGMGEPRSGYQFELVAIAVVIVGGTSLTGGRGTIGGSFIGLLIFAVVMNIMNLLNISSFVQPIVRGLIIILAALVISRMLKSKASPGVA